MLLTQRTLLDIMGGKLPYLPLPEKERKLFDIGKIFFLGTLRISLTAKVSRIRGQGLHHATRCSRCHRSDRLLRGNVLKFLAQK